MAKTSGYFFRLFQGPLEKPTASIMVEASDVMDAMFRIGTLELRDFAASDRGGVEAMLLFPEELQKIFDVGLHWGTSIGVEHVVAALNGKTDWGTNPEGGARSMGVEKIDGRVAIKVFFLKKAPV